MASIVVSGDVSGTVTLSAPSTAGTTTLTLPTTSGTVLTSASSVASSQLPTGSVLQVVSTTKTDVASTTSSTFTDVSGLSVSITPSSSSNKILVVYNVAASNDTGGGFLQLVRGSTPIAVGTAATGNQLNVTLGNYYSSDTNTFYTGAGSYLDSPATTSSTTYKFQFRIGTGGTITVNRNYSNANFAYTGVAVSSITVMEIKG
jgi:hypothetical protein